MDEEKDKFARENGPDLEYVGLLRKCMYGTVDASARWQAHYLQILKEHRFVQGFTVTTSWWRCPLMKRNGSKASCSRNTMERAR